MGRPGSSLALAEPEQGTHRDDRQQPAFPALVRRGWCWPSGSQPQSSSGSAATRSSPQHSSIFFVNPDFGRRQSAAAAAEIRPRSTFAAAADQSGEYLQYTVSTVHSIYSVQYSIYSTLGTVTWSRDPAEDAMCDPTPDTSPPPAALLITTSTSALLAVVLCSLCLCVCACKKLRGGRSQVYEGPV